MAISHAARHAIWMRTLLAEMRAALGGAIELWADNQSAIALSKSNVHHARTKHIDIRYHFIRDQVERGVISLEYRKTDDNAADVFTKPLARARLEYLAQMIGVRAL